MIIRKSLSFCSALWVFAVSALPVGIALAPIEMAKASQPIVLYYRFNTGPNGAALTEAQDSGPNNLNGSVTGPLTYSNDAAYHKFSLNATGDVDYITLAQTDQNAGLLNQTTHFTLSAAAKPTGGTTRDTQGDAIAAKLAIYSSGPCDTTYGIYYSAATGHFTGLVCGAGMQDYFITATDVSAMGVWHTINLVFNVHPLNKTATLVMKVDSKLEGSLKITNFGGLLTGSGAFQVGASNIVCNTCTYRRNFIGYIDHVLLTGVSH